MTAAVVAPSLWSADDAAMHLDTLFGPYESRGVGGTLRIGWRRNWTPDENFRHQFYLWPLRREWYLYTAEKAVNASVDVYCEFNLRVADERAERPVSVRYSPSVLPLLHTIAFDLDEAKSYEADALERLQKAGAMLVSSGTPGHIHAYLVSPEPLAHETLAKQKAAVKQRLGLDRVLGLSQPLRLAGTANFKPQNADGAPCRVISEADPSLYGRGVRDLAGVNETEWWAPPTPSLEPWAGKGLTGTKSEDWHDIAKGTGSGRPQGDGHSGIPFRHQISFGWFCDLWERGYDDDEAYRLTLWTAKHGEPSERRRAVAIIDKFGTAEALQQESMRVFGKREAKSTEAERRDRPGRRSAYGAVPECGCCTMAGAS